MMKGWLLKEDEAVGIAGNLQQVFRVSHSVRGWEELFIGSFSELVEIWQL
ncbi:hypothetical protein Misp06_03753 [Microbulbifer sp. NBRC 101763]|nr:MULTISPECIES: hypothetical protein [Microbulbifer]WHI50384.1 hypothetical protein P3339_18345 [Microbulbifer sp. MLAF003]